MKKPVVIEKNPSKPNYDNRPVEKPSKPFDNTYKPEPYIRSNPNTRPVIDNKPVNKPNRVDPKPQSVRPKTPIRMQDKPNIQRSGDPQLQKNKPRK